MDLVEGIQNAYNERIDLLVLALTGRTGSGCTTAAAILTKPFHDISLSPDDYAEPERRKMTIAQDFARVQWRPFHALSVSLVIFTFLWEEPWSDIEKLLIKHSVQSPICSAVKIIYDQTHVDSNYALMISAINSQSMPGNETQAWSFFNQTLNKAFLEIRNLLTQKFQPLFQEIGDNIRYSGSALDSSVDPNQLFTLMRRVKALIRIAERSDREQGHQSTRIVIDAIRNPLELVYLRDQFGSFYAIAITTDDEIRKLRLQNLSLSNTDIQKIDAKEYNTNKKFLDDYASFVSQNLQDCIQKSDVFINNPGKPADYAQKIRSLSAQLVRYVALALRPGLVTPTRDERCMQIAFVAKLNSGCISRQVGAAVTDKHYSIKSVGWNDVAKGQVPCLLRDVDSLLTGNDSTAFSDYEQTNQPLQTHLRKTTSNRNSLRTNDGLRCPYCFKDAYNTVTGKPNQVHTRSLHAEENAFLQLAKYGNAGIESGVLYTTASPCELCSKKAYQLGIKEIVYVDPYPGISSSHVLAYGPIEQRPMLRLFNGAVGHAYHRLYDPILSIKDEYGARLKVSPQPQLALKVAK